ncbi:MAG: transporter [Xanthomonadales bacterium]|nr:transporter [Xanthomonadales bacterium]ODU92793.1 MAG: hypothetical protein ABT18_10700 [Rhodanobacter sp. SCN 66-43]OJY84213.1 MAG: hypothetical protein BGP23_15135 [Xanthomonadales bacterium 66-474]
MFRCFALLVAWLGVAVAAHAQSADGSYRQSRDDAWWTGPMLANSADTLPRGHVLIEPYLYDVASKGADRFGSRAYVLYGLTDRLTVGLIPIIGYNRISGAPDSSRVGFADQILQAQFRLTRFQEGSRLPTISLLLQESVPTGRYDRLQRASDGMGQGAWATTLGVNAQSYFWMPNGRILRVRLNLARTFASHADVDGASVFGTGSDFQGRASLGAGYSIDTAFEYSLTRRWVLALDLFHSHNDATHLVGHDDTPGLPRMPVRTRIGASDAFGYAPAVEYNFSPTLGVLLGVRVITGGHNTQRSVTPAIAVNYVH